MKRLRAGYQVIPYPRYMRFSAAAYQSVRRKPMIHGLLEADVTEARAALREYKARTGESLSFTAFLCACLGKAVDEHKAVQAFRLSGNRLILFDDVDICIRIERELAGQKYVEPYIVRAANRKTFRELHDEIRTAQVANVRDPLKWLRFLPAALYRPFIWAFTRIARRRPQVWKANMGTVGVTSVGMFGRGAGWGIPLAAPTPLMVTIGGIGEKQTLVEGRVEVREYLNLTISVDHEVIDGAPATRFTQRFKELIESGYGLAGTDMTACRGAKSFPCEPSVTRITQ
ncbi:MAG TPA: 2-oxo acid dehydrogenase subunit E2 [Ktedonobacterales bacterium]|jgi:pyruvate/2-oxoglutarate dehydrogenase complex dihydrolipoamide acyltransferase (E2) component